MKRVAVLLSTYNGEKYLAPQLESLLAQEAVDLRVFVRDDGSRDASVGIVAEYARRDGRISLISAQNVGVVKSFFLLLQQCGPDFDYYALCDQDDVWDRDKLRAAIDQLDTLPAGPRLYCSTVAYVDADMKPLGMSNTRQRPSFGNALIENIATGCTSVFSRELRELLITHIPQRTVMHDWWAYLIAAGLGQVVYDPLRHIHYRQHGGNVIGGSASAMEMWRRRWRRFRAGGGGVLATQAEEFQRQFGASLSADKQVLLARFVAAKKQPWLRLLLCFSPLLRRQTSIDTLVFKVLILMGRF